MKLILFRQICLYMYYFDLFNMYSSYCATCIIGHSRHILIKYQPYYHCTHRVDICVSPFAMKMF